MSREFQVTFDAADPIRLSLFWAEALDYVVQQPPGSSLPPETPASEVLDAWTSFLTQAGVPPERHRSASAVVDPAGDGPRVFFQQVPEPKTGKNRVHIDVVAEETVDDEVIRLEGLGATLRNWAEEDGNVWAVMLDPEGNEFCVMPPEA